MLSLVSILKEFETRSSPKDDRDGHGYGRIGEPKGAGTTWVMGADYPYVKVGNDATEEEMIEMDDDEDYDMNKMMSKLTSTFYTPHDPMGQRTGRVDRATFASGGRGLGEALGNVAIPGMYKHRDSGLGGGIKYTTNRPQRTGMKYGWSMRPPVYDDAPGEDLEPVYHIEDLPSDDERALMKAKREHEVMVSEFKIYLGGIRG
jgi:hypothetical protein